MNILLYPKEPWIRRRAAGISTQTGKPLHIAKKDAETEHRMLQSAYQAIRKNTKAPVLRLEPETLSNVDLDIPITGTCRNLAV
jgi:hypothetical protein